MIYSLGVSEVSHDNLKNQYQALFVCSLNSRHRSLAGLEIIEPHGYITHTCQVGLFQCYFGMRFKCHEAILVYVVIYKKSYTFFFFIIKRQGKNCLDFERMSGWRIWSMNVCWKLFSTQQSTSSNSPLNSGIDLSLRLADPSMILPAYWHLNIYIYIYNEITD